MTAVEVLKEFYDNEKRYNKRKDMTMKVIKFILGLGVLYIFIVLFMCL